MNEAEHLRETQHWLRYAHEDLAGAETLLEQRVVVPRHICWLAQQSAEKALKAILVFLALDFPRRHDLDALRHLVPDDWQVKTEQADLAALTEWAVEARYPGDWPDATEADARVAVEQARTVWASIQADFRRHGLIMEETS